MSKRKLDGRIQSIAASFSTIVNSVWKKSWKQSLLLLAWKLQRNKYNQSERDCNESHKILKKIEKMNKETSQVYVSAALIHLTPKVTLDPV